MERVRDVAEVMEAVDRAKARASAFCTNLFPVRQKLQDWIDHDELFGDVLKGVACFFRRDRDFWHFYFVAPDIEMLGRALNASPQLKTERVIADVVGHEAVVGELVTVFTSVGFRPYNRLFRMVRMAQPIQVSTFPSDASIGVAETSDAEGILELLNRSFDPYAEQLPRLYEIRAAILSNQCLVAKCSGSLAGLLFFETAGYTSSVRYWLVAEDFRAQHVGSALMNRYFLSNVAVRRFLLWVIADNENAINKYHHYGYGSDGLVDHVLANGMIST